MAGAKPAKPKAPRPPKPKPAPGGTPPGSMAFPGGPPPMGGRPPGAGAAPLQGQGQGAPQLPPMQQQQQQAQYALQRQQQQQEGTDPGDAEEESEGEEPAADARPQPSQWEQYRALLEAAHATLPAAFRRPDGPRMGFVFDPVPHPADVDGGPAGANKRKRIVLANDYVAEADEEGVKQLVKKTNRAPGTGAAGRGAGGRWVVVVVVVVVVAAVVTGCREHAVHVVVLLLLLRLLAYSSWMVQLRASLLGGWAGGHACGGVCVRQGAGARATQPQGVRKESCCVTAFACHKSCPAAPRA